jgi:CubicO group peptidase (beta-lactamase class C family)
VDVGVVVEALDEFVPQILEVSQTPGVSVALGVGDDVAWAKGYGLADLGAARPMAPDTVAPIGSDSKTYTAAAIMQLVERGLLGLDDPVNDHLHGLRVVNPHGRRQITLRDLLTHRSGLGTTFGYADRTPPAPLGDHLREVFRHARSDLYGGTLVPLWSTPVGSQYQYSNTGLALVGYLVELLNPDGVSFAEWVRRHVFTPLDMASTCFPPVQDEAHVPAELLARRSTGYATLGGYQFPLPQIHIGDYPAGSAMSTASDHARFVLAMLAGGRLLGAPLPILRADTAAAMLAPQAPMGPNPNACVGLVWNVFDHGTPACHVGHGGEYFWGWSNFTRGWPAQRVCVVVAANQWHLADLGTSDRPSHLAGRLIGDVVTAWVNGADPRPRRSAAAALSYLAGMIVADRLSTRIGARTPLTAADAEAVADAAIASPGTPWDPAAFRLALREVDATGGTMADVIALANRRLANHHLGLLQHQIGMPRLRELTPPAEEWSP